MTDYYSETIKKPLNFLCETGRLQLQDGYYSYQLFLQENHLDYNQFKQNDSLWIIIKYDGCSSIIEAFNNYGPFKYENNNINLHPNSYNKITNILYIDQPFGVGYSEGQLDLNESALNIVKFLQEFLHKKGMNNLKLYLYGKELAAWLITKIIDVSIYYQLNFSGIILENGWVSPIHQIGFYGSFLYQLGIIDSKKRDNIYYNQTSLQVQLLNQNFTNTTELNDIIQKMQDVFQRFEKYNKTIIENEIMNYINENAQQFYGLNSKNITSCNQMIRNQLKIFYQNSSLQAIESLLQKDKDIIIIATQLDLKINVPGITYWINQLKWINIMKWRQQQKELVYDLIQDKERNITQKQTVGYIKQFTRLKYIVAYNEKYKLLKQLFIDY